MKKFLIAAIACGMLASCAYEPIKSPIEGTKLFTYTAENSELLGIGCYEPGEEIIITEPLYKKVQHSYGYIVATGGNDKLYLLDNNYAQPVVKNSFDYIVMASGYFLMTNREGKYYFDQNTKELIGPKQDFVRRGVGVLLVKGNNGKWGVNGVLDDKYDEIIIVRQNEKNEYRFVVKEGKKYQLLDAKGKVLKKSLTPQAVKRLLNVPKKFVEQKWEKDGVVDITVENLKSAI